MSFILAIEPDTANAEGLRDTIPGRVGADLVIVSSSTGAILEIDKRVPDLLLVGRSISPSDQEVVVAHTRSKVPGSNLLTLAIPELKVGKVPERRSTLGLKFKGPVREEGWDPNLFAGLATCVAEVEARRRSAVQGHDAPDRSKASATSDSQKQAVEESIVSSVAADVRATLITQVQKEAETWLSDELGRIVAEAAEQRTRDLEVVKREAAASHEAALKEVRAVAEAGTRDVVSAELAQVRLEVEATLASELSRLRADAERMPAVDPTHAIESELKRVRAEMAAEMKGELTAQLTAVKAEMAARMPADMKPDMKAKLMAEIDTRFKEERARLAEEVDRVRGEAAKRVKAEMAAEMKGELTAELTALKAEMAARMPADMKPDMKAELMAEIDTRFKEERTRLAEEVDRVRGESGKRIKAEVTAEMKGELTAELTAVKAEMAARMPADMKPDVKAKLMAEIDARFIEERRRLAEEIDRVRGDAAKQHADDHAALEREAAASRGEALEQARTAAAETRSAMSAEFAKARKAAEEKLTTDLARVRAEAKTRFETELGEVLEEAKSVLEKEQARHEADAKREGAAREARAAAEKAAARQFQEELAKVQAETNARLETELGRFRKEADQVRSAKDQVQREIDTLRERAERQARSIAEEAVARTIRGEFANFKSETESRLEADLAFLRQVATEGRGEQPIPQQAAPPQSREEAKPDLRKGLGPIAIATAATAAVVVTLLTLGLPVAAKWFGGPSTTATLAPQDPVEPSPAPTPTPARRRPALDGSKSNPDDGRPAAKDGFLSVSAKIPLELYAGDQRLGTTEDGRLPIAAGPQVIRVVNERFNFRGELPIDIRPGKVTTHTVALPRATVRVETTPGAEIWIDEEHMGTAPLGGMEVPIGNREVVVKHPELGQRRQSIDVKVGETADVKLFFNNEEQP